MTLESMVAASDEQLPRSLEAEQAVLGSLLLDRDAIVEVNGLLRPEDFAFDAHATIFRVMVDLYEQQRPVDVVTVMEEVERRDLLQRAGGRGYLTTLVDVVPTAAHVEHYSRIVERLAVLRRLIQAGAQIMGIAQRDGIDADEAISRSEEALLAVSQGRITAGFSPVHDILAAILEKLDYLHEHRGAIAGVPTGFVDVDRLLGGLQKSDLVILGARPAQGKCLAADTLIDDPLTGERVTIECFVRQRRPLVSGMACDGSVVTKAIGAWIDSGVQPCFLVRTRTGREVKVTGHHPFFTATGWTPLHDLGIGTAIAVPARLPVFGGDVDTPPELVRQLAQRLAEAAVSAAADSGYCGANLALPACVWTWDRPTLARFLHVLIGHAATFDDGDRPRIELAVASSRLASDVQHALLRLGIIAGRRRQARRSWAVTVAGRREVATYRRAIGCDGAGDRHGAEEDAPPGEDDLQASHPSSGIRPEVANPDLYWDEITHIEPVGAQHVYDLTVPDGSNFIADGVFVHNTALALGMCHNAAIRYKQRVAIFSLEMSKEQLVQRLLCMQGRLDNGRLRSGYIDEDEWTRLIEAASVLSGAKIFIDDSAGITPGEMRNRARRLQAEYGLDLIVVDYLQLMQGRSGENRVQEISGISRALKVLARELNVPVLALSQVSRAVDSRTNHVPMLSDLRESGSIEQDADVVLFLCREEMYDPETEKRHIADVIVAKHRNGPTGQLSLYFDQQQTRFRDLEAQPVQGL